MNDAARLERCEREITEALAASEQVWLLKERLGILQWEMDWRVERQSLIEKGKGQGHPEVRRTEDESAGEQSDATGSES